MKMCLLLLLIFTTTHAFAQVTAYFNHYQRSSYSDPYRNIRRNGHNLEEVLVQEIQKARTSIFVAVQELRLPLVAQALVEKKKQNVDVRVVLENSYNFTVLRQRDSRNEGEHEASSLRELQALVDVNRNGRFEKEELLTRDAIYMLQDAGIPVIDDTFDGSRGSGLMHHKFIIIDGKTTVVSTANFTLSCIHGDLLDRTSRGNANSMIVVESRNFARIFNDEFSQLWGNGRRGNFGHNKTYRGPITTSVHGTKITVQFSPTSQRYNWEESVNGLIASQMAKARKSIKALLFVFSDQKLADVMQDRQEKNADIGVFIEPKFAFRNYSELLDLMGLEMLDKKCEYEPYNNPWKSPAKEVGMANLPDGDVLHHKFAVIDDKTVVMGSQNWSDAANFINDETLIVIQNPGIAAGFTQEYNRIKRSSRTGPSRNVLDKIRKQEQECGPRRY